MNEQTQATIDRLSEFVDGKVAMRAIYGSGEFDQLFLDDIAAARMALVAANATVELVEASPMDNAAVQHAHRLWLTLTELPRELTAEYLHEQYPNADVAEVVVMGRDGKRHDYTWADFFARLGIEG